MKRFTISFFIVAAMMACHGGRQQAPPANPVLVKKDSVHIFKAAMLDSKKDPTCGMPSSAAMEDTLILNGKVIGFCSKECKEAFKKDSKQYVIEYK